MGKLKSFSIEFDRPNRVYYVNETVSGRVVVALNEKMPMQRIELTGFGLAKVHWKKQRGESTLTVENAEQYLSFVAVLSGLEPFIRKPGSNPILPAGVHQFPFSFSLPPRCQSSFEGPPIRRTGYSRIRYHCAATIKRSWRSDHNVLESFTVLRHYDLNAYPNLAVPYATEETHSPGGLSNVFSGDKITVRVQVPKRGYVPGETIDLTIDVANKSDVKIESILLDLMQLVTCVGRISLRGKERTKGAQRLVAHGSRRVTVEAHETKQLKISFTVPPVAPSILDYPFLSVRYQLRTSVVPDATFFRHDFNMTFPITLGTVPISYTAAANGSKQQQRLQQCRR